MYNESDKVLWSENMSAKLFTKEIKKTQQRRTRMRSFETEFAIWINARVFFGVTERCRAIHQCFENNSCKWKTIARMIVQNIYF